MKDYHDVVKDRFNQEADDNSIYSPKHPIGKYSRTYLFKELHSFLIHYSQKMGSLEAKKILDLGCGSGGMMEFFLGEGVLEKNLTGVDFSEARISKAKLRYPEIDFLCGDALSFDLDKKPFDLITSFDLFSHFTTKDQILKGLKNIYEHLSEDGEFLWYDIYSLDHYNPTPGADSWGFNKKQVVSLSNEAGFQPVYYKPLFKNFFNHYHSIYQVGRFSPKIVNFLEKVLPGTPGNFLLGLEKKN